MNSKSIGLKGFIGGGFLLSLELYMLNIVQLIDKLTNNSWFQDKWEYARRFPCNIAIIITLAVMTFSAFVFFTAKDE